MDTATKQSPVDGSVVVELGGRKLSLASNGFSAGLILEHLGIDIYREFHRLQTVNAGQWGTLIWALCHNKGNGPKEQWPTLDEIEEELTMDAMPDLVEATFLALSPRSKREQLKNALREVRKEIGDVIDSAFLTSAPSQESTSESPEQSSTN